VIEPFRGFETIKATQRDVPFAFEKRYCWTVVSNFLIIARPLSVPGYHDEMVREYALTVWD
jgi:hypothetical protein